MNIHSTLASCLLAASGLYAAAADNEIKLPAPDKTGGKPLMQALQARQSTREFKEQAIPLETLSSLLWAAQGVNRNDPEYRTAPSSRNANEIELYVVLPEATYLYQPATHRLLRIIQGDLRAATGTQDFVGKAPLNLVYVADQSKQPGDFDASRKTTTACADAGFIGQNVYLFCASSGLGTVFRAMLDAEQLQKLLKLPFFKKVLYAQSIGYPAT